MAQIESGGGNGKGKNHQKNDHPCGLHPDGGHEHVAYHILHALYNDD